MTNVLLILSSSCLPRSCQLFLFRIFCDFLLAGEHPVFGAVFPELLSDLSLSVFHSIWSPVRHALQSWCLEPSQTSATQSDHFSLPVVIPVSSLCSSCCLHPQPHDLPAALLEKGPAHFLPLAGSHCDAEVPVNCLLPSTVQQPVPSSLSNEPWHWPLAHNVTQPSLTC